MPSLLLSYTGTTMWRSQLLVALCWLALVGLAVSTGEKKPFGPGIHYDLTLWLVFSDWEDSTGGAEGLTKVTGWFRPHGALTLCLSTHGSKRIPSLSMGFLLSPELLRICAPTLWLLLADAGTEDPSAWVEVMEEKEDTDPPTVSSWTKAVATSPGRERGKQPRGAGRGPRFVYGEGTVSDDSTHTTKGGLSASDRCSNARLAKWHTDTPTILAGLCWKVCRPHLPGWTLPGVSLASFKWTKAILD